MIPKFRVWLTDIDQMLRVKALVFEKDKTRCVCGYSSVHRFPGTLLSVGEQIQLKMLFYKRLRNFTTNRLLTFRESDWRFFIGNLINEFAH